MFRQHYSRRIGMIIVMMIVVYSVSHNIINSIFFHLMMLSRKFSARTASDESKIAENLTVFI